MNEAGRAKISIWLYTIGSIAAYLLLIWETHWLFISKLIDSFAVSLVLAFSLIQYAIIAAILLILLFAKLKYQAQLKLVETVYKEIREELAVYSMSLDSPIKLKRLFRKYPREVENCIVEFISMLTGAERVRISHLTVELGLAGKWKQLYRSRKARVRERAVVQLGFLSEGIGNDILVEAANDVKESIRVEAGFAMIRSGRQEEIERAFAIAVGQSLLQRAIMAESLEPHALMLSKRALPAELFSGDRRRALITLEMIRTWQKTLPIENFFSLFDEKDSELRAAALRTLPFVSAFEDATPIILAALDDKDAKIRSAASAASAALGLKEAAPLLKKGLREENEDAALAAAYALAGIGSDGIEVLEKELTSAERSAATALEALEKARLGRYDRLKI